MEQGYFSMEEDNRLPLDRVEADVVCRQMVLYIDEMGNLVSG